MSTETLTQMGQDYYSQTYGDNSQSVLGLLTEIYPDLGLPLTSFTYYPLLTTVYRSPFFHGICIWICLLIPRSSLRERNFVCDDCGVDCIRHASSNRLALERCNKKRCNSLPSQSSQANCYRGRTNRGCAMEE